MRRVIAGSPQKEHDILKAIGASASEEIVISKVASISKEVYDDIQSEKLFAISTELADVQQYINEVFREVWNRGRVSDA